MRENWLYANRNSPCEEQTNLDLTSAVKHSHVFGQPSNKGDNSNERHKIRILFHIMNVREIGKNGV
jgi:hypothetical protein